MDGQLRNARFKVENTYPDAEFRRYEQQWRLEAEGHAISGAFDTMEEALYDAAFTLPGPYTRPTQSPAPLLSRVWTALSSLLRAPLVPLRSLFNR